MQESSFLALGKLSQPVAPNSTYLQPPRPTPTGNTTRVVGLQPLKVQHDAEFAERIRVGEAETLDLTPRPELELSPPRSSRLNRWDHYDTAHRKVSVASMLNPKFDLILRRPIDRRIFHHDCKDVQL